VLKINYIHQRNNNNIMGLLWKVCGGGWERVEDEVVRRSTWPWNWK